MTEPAVLWPLLLPTPHELWARWAAQCCALAAIGYQDVVWADPSGMHSDDHGGNRTHLRLFNGGRAVLYGLDHEYSDTTWATPPIDLLRGAPAWVPVADIERDCPVDELGFLVWWEDEGWLRVSYPVAMNDGLVAVCSPALDDERATREAASVVWDWGGFPDDRPSVREEVSSAAGDLIAAAHSKTVTRDVLKRLVGRLDGESTKVDLEVAMAAARRAGVCEGSALPVSETGRLPHGRRRRRRLSDEQHQALVWSAMREQPELRRSSPKAAKRQLRRLLRWLDERRPTADGPVELLLWLVRNSAGGGSSNLSPYANSTLDEFSELVALAAQLQEREEVAGQGRWLFLRVCITASGHTVERAYDHWPAWWPDESSDGPPLDALRRELGSRDQQWRPRWSEQLATEVVYEDVEY